MSKSRFSLFLLLILTAISLVAQTNADIEKLKKQQQVTKKEIKQTNKQINETAKQTRNQLHKLDKLKADISRNASAIQNERATLSGIESETQSLNDTIAELEINLSELQDAYARTLRNLQTAADPVSQLSFIFSSESMQQAYRRLRYLKQFSKWRKAKADKVAKAKEELEDKRLRLNQLATARNDALQRLELAHRQAQRQQTEVTALVDKLKKEEGSLRQVLKKKQQEQRDLDRRIDKLIAQEIERQEKARKKAEEARKANNKNHASGASESATASKVSNVASGIAEADRRLSGSFAANKGSLLFPVAGRYTIVKGFGVQQHPELRHVTTENSGIDIEVSPGTAARAVFAGKVSAIFQQPGYNSIVMLRHGDYITIYAGLAGLKVKNGQEVKAGQELGTIFSDGDNDNATVLHFEIRKEREKLNPIAWVR